MKRPFYKTTVGVVAICGTALVLLVGAALLWYPPLFRPGAAPDAAEPFFEEQADGLVNLNTAPAAEISVLPGIGEVRAAAIVEWREENGPFEVVEQVMEVKGIGPKTFEGIEEYVCI